MNYKRYLLLSTAVAFMAANDAGATKATPPEELTPPENGDKPPVDDGLDPNEGSDPKSGDDRPDVDPLDDGKVRHQTGLSLAERQRLTQGDHERERFRQMPLEHPDAPPGGTPLALGDHTAIEAGYGANSGALPADGSTPGVGTGIHNPDDLPKDGDDADGDKDDVTA